MVVDHISWLSGYVLGPQGLKVVTPVTIYHADLSSLGCTVFCCREAGPFNQCWLCKDGSTGWRALIFNQMI